jgi:hypothetical protein
LAEIHSLKITFEGGLKAGPKPWMWAIVDIALEDDGGAVSAYEISARREALLPLDRAARHALVAAGSPEAWPH